MLDQAGRGAAHQGVAHMGTAVGGCAGPCDEAIPRRDATAVGVQRAGDARAQPLHSLVEIGQGADHSGSSTTSATICGLTSMSGCTPIMRSVCCTTSLNTGAATAPP